VKITLTSDDSIRLEAAPGPMTVEAERADQQYSPFHMLGSSLATCEYSLLASWATHAKISSDDLAIEVSWTFANDPHRVADMRIKLVWPSLPETRRQAAMRAVELCPIHRTLRQSPTIDVEVAK
jgi:uncharacterized OsmC-like protein